MRLAFESQLDVQNNISCIKYALRWFSWKLKLTNIPLDTQLLIVKNHFSKIYMGFIFSPVIEKFLYVHSM